MAIVPNDKDNITIGLPKPSGALFWAPAGTALPVDAEVALNAAFINLGYVTEDGLTSTVAEDGDDIKAWGPETVGRSQTNYAKTYVFSLLETARVTALQFVYGQDNVEIDVDGNITIDETGEQLPRGILVCDTLQNNGGATPRIKRQILGDAQFTDRSGDQVHNNSDPLNFPVSVSAYKFTSGSKQVYTKTFISAVAP
jgi:hypothetical protein